MIGFLYFIREDKQNKERERATSMNNIYSHYEEDGDNDGMEEEMERLAAGTEALPRTSAGAGVSGGATSDETQRKNPLKKRIKTFLYTFSLRRFDMLVLCLSILSYTVFFVVMYATGRTGTGWLKNDPDFFDEDFAPDLSELSFVNGDPNNRR